MLGEDTGEGGRPVLLALAGRVPVKVASTSGELKAGDILAASDEPGKAMKATRPGQAIGKALEDWSPTSGKATVLTFVNNYYYDPDVYLTDTGDISVVANQPSPDLPVVYGVKNARDEVLTRVGIFSDMAVGTAKVGKMSAEQLIVAGKDVNDRLNRLEQQSTISTQSGQLEEKVTSLSDQIQSLQDKTASLEASVNLLMTGNSLNNAASFVASSASELSVDTLDAKDATIGNTLTVMGRTILSDVGITGKLTMGLLSINGLDESGAAAINTSAGALRLQSDGLNAVDILNGKVVFETSGNVTVKGIMGAKTINTSKLNIVPDPDATSSAKPSASAGTIIIPTGKTSMDITTSALTSKSLIFATPDVPVGVGAKAIDIDTFRVSLQQAQSQDIKVNWWIVN